MEILCFKNEDKSTSVHLENCAVKEKHTQNVKEKEFKRKDGAKEKTRALPEKSSFTFKTAPREGKNLRLSLFYTPFSSVYSVSALDTLFSALCVCTSKP